MVELDGTFICQLQRVYAGRRPVRFTAILKNNGLGIKGGA